MISICRSTNSYQIYIQVKQSSKLFLVYKTRPGGFGRDHIVILILKIVGLFATDIDFIIVFFFYFSYFHFALN